MPMPDRLLDEVSLASVFEQCTWWYTILNEGTGFASDGVAFLYERCGWKLVFLFVSRQVTLVSWASVCDKGTFRKGSVFAAYFQLIHSFTHTIYNFTRASTRVKKSLIKASLRASSPIWASEASRERTREGPRKGEISFLHPRYLLSCLLSRASRESTFHDIPQIESLFAV